MFSSRTNGWDRLPAHREALVVAEARLLDVHVHVADRPGHADRLVLRPAGVRVGDQPVGGLQRGADVANPGDVDVRVAADLELEPGIAFGPVAGHLAGHLLRRLLRDRPIELNPLAEPAAEQRADRQARRLAEDVPAGDVDARLHERMALQGRVHALVELGELARIHADQVRAQLAEPGADSVRIGGQVERAERAHLAVTDDAGVGLDADDRAVEDADRLAA